MGRERKSLFHRELVASEILPSDPREEKGKKKGTERVRLKGRKLDELSSKRSGSSLPSEGGRYEGEKKKDDRHKGKEKREGAKKSR